MFQKKIPISSFHLALRASGDILVSQVSFRGEFFSLHIDVVVHRCTFKDFHHSEEDDHVTMT